MSRLIAFINVLSVVQKGLDEAAIAAEKA